MSGSQTNEEDLYQKILLKHARQPVGFGVLEEFDLVANGVNRLCGDSISIYIELSNSKIIERVSFSGESCAICKGTASMLMAQLPGKCLDDASSLVSEFNNFVECWDDGSFEAFSPLKVIKNFPTRLKCMKLPWETLQAAIVGNKQDVSTE